MKDIYLHGRLAEFGECFSLDVRDPKEAIHALTMQLPGFRDSLEQGSWHVFKGPLDRENDLDADGLDVAFGKEAEVHIMPAAEGAGGVFKALVGVLLLGPQLAVSLVTTGASGFTDFLTTTPKVASYSSRERPEERPSFLFDGPVNTSTQGLPVPIIAGRMRVGSVVISAGITAEDIPLEGEE